MIAFRSNSFFNYDQNKKLGLLVTPYQNRKLPVYDWYNYKHSFSRDLVTSLIREFQLNGQDKILDPFCGSGTTLLASKEMGIPVQGLDILPLSVFVSNAKLMKYDREKIQIAISEIENLLEQKKIDCGVCSLRKELLIKWFPEEVLDKVLFIRDWIEKACDENLKHFFLTALLSILEEVSYTYKGGGFLRVEKSKRIPDLKSTYLARLHKMLMDIDIIDQLPDSQAKAVEGDARRTTYEPASFSGVITSPPYPNRHDYTRVYLLELIVGFITREEEIKNLRYFSIQSHVEAKKRYLAEDYHLPDSLYTTLKELGKRSLPNKGIVKMLEGYFEDMHLTLKEIRRLIRPSGKVAFVIGDARYGGVKVPVGDILVEIGNNLGLELIEKILVRLRGNSPQQMKVYGREPLGEYILMWERK